MSDDLEILRTRMEAAAAALDFEEARRLRDEIERLSAGDMAASRLRRQQPGKMGLGTSDQVFVPPPGWKPPKKPDPMTRGHSGPKRRR